MKNILITGAGGFLGSYLIEALIREQRYKILAFDLTSENLIKQFGKYQDICFFDENNWVNRSIPFGKLDSVIHLAFGRTNKGEQAITSGLNFTNDLFNLIIQNKVPSLMHISSQEVYGNLPPILRKESVLVSPNSPYGMAKFAGEILTRNVGRYSNAGVTSLRLAGLLGKETNSRMVNKFVHNAIHGIPIKIVGGSQVLSQLDVRDAASAISALLKIPCKLWKECYNLGYPRSYTIKEISKIIVEVAEQFVNHPIKIEVEESDIDINAEMDSSLFYQDTGWQPQHDMRAIVKSIFEYQVSQNGYQEI